MKYCTHCGTPFPEGKTWPKKCAGCTNLTWRNPTPVSVILIPCDGRLIGIRRQNTVRAGYLSEPGGFVTSGETWQEAGAREVKEETNIDIDPSTISLYDTVSTPDGGTILIFGLAPEIEKSALPEFIPNHEASERVFLEADTPLAFPIHEIITKRYFSERK